MSFKLLTEGHLEFLCLKGGYTDSSESTSHVKMPHCWKAHIRNMDNCRFFFYLLALVAILFSEVELFMQF